LLRPQQRIVALTYSPEVQRELALIWGVESLISEPAESTEEMLKTGEETLLQAGVVTKGEMIVVMAGRLSGLGLSSSVTLFNVGGSPEPTRTENAGNVSRWVFQPGPASLPHPFGLVLGIDSCECSAKWVPRSFFTNLGLGNIFPATGNYSTLSAGSN
jgi:hypothetical protein